VTENIRLEEGRIRVGARFSVSFQRTLRIPDDGRQYPLPPGLGMFPVRRVTDYARRVPAEWRERGGFFVPMYQREAMWLGFDAAEWKPNAVKVGIGGIDALSGLPWSPDLHDDPQNYVVCPDQPWLDGINAGEGFVRQFVAMPLGSGYTVEGQLTGAERVGGLELRVFEPKPGRFPDRPPPRPAPGSEMMVLESAAPGGMGLAAGGRMTQKIYPDPYGLDTWDQASGISVHVHIVTTEQYEAITGEPPPPTPIDARTYTERGFPWFALYDETRGDLAAARRLRGIRSTAEIDEASGRGGSDERPLEVKRGQVRGTAGKLKTENKN
jgi:hypothetical protein